MYFIKQKSPMYIVSDSAGKIQYWYLNDKPDFSKKDQRFLEQYLTDGSEILEREVRIIADIARPFTEKDESRLASMLALLVYARKVWEEESTRP
jgi:hypothetical protein